MKGIKVYINISLQDLILTLALMTAVMTWLPMQHVQIQSISWVLNSTHPMSMKIPPLPVLKVIESDRVPYAKVFPLMYVGQIVVTFSVSCA